MENKESLDKEEIKKDRGDNLKKVIKPKVVPKKDLEITKDLIKDRGDSISKPVKGKVIHHKSIKPIESSQFKSNNNLEKNPKDLVSDRNNRVRSKQNENEAIISNNFDKTVPARFKRPKLSEAESKSCDKSAPTNLMTDPITKQSEEIYILDNKTHRDKKRNKEICTNFEKVAPISLPITYRASVSKPNKSKVFLRNDKKDKGTLRNDFDKIGPEHKKPVEASINNNKKTVPVVRKSIVENDKHVNQQLYMEEKKRIRDKYTIKPRAIVNNKLLDNKSNTKDSQVEDNNDILMDSTNNETQIKEKASECTKADKVLESKEKSQKRPIIKTIIAKNDITKVYKAVTFGEQKRKLNTTLQIKIPVCLKNTNTPNDIASGNIKTPKNQPNGNKIEEGIMKNFKTLQNDGDTLPKTINKDKTPPADDHSTKTPFITKLLDNNIDSLMLNVKKPKSPFTDKGNWSRNMQKTRTTQNDDNLTKKIKMSDDTVQANKKIRSNISSNNKKIQKLQNIGDGLKSKAKVRKLSQSSESRSSAKTRLSKMEKRNRLNSKLSLFSFATGSGSPLTEVAKWAPNSINKHTQPYYEAWVDTTLAAISKKSKEEKYCAHRNLVNSFKNLLQQRNESPELMYENYLDERYTGKIKINHRK